jgi:hypothetical protein
MVDSLHGIISAFPLLFRTDDGGYSWQRIQRPPQANLQRYAFIDVICLHPDSYLILMGKQDAQRVVVRTDDGGAHWSVAPVDSMRNLCFVDSLHGWGAGAGLNGPGSRGADIVARTTNGGRTWETQLNQHIPADFGLQHTDFADLENGIAVGRAGKVLHTTNGGVDWVRGINLDSAFGVINLSSVAYPDRGHAWAVGFGHILHYGENSSGVDDHRLLHAASGSLTIVPNPLSVSGSIEFQVRQAGHARIVIVDLLGREVRSLLDDAVEAGMHRIPIDATNITSGTSFLRFQVGDTLVTEQVSMVR